MAHAAVKCKFCGKPIVMRGAPDIPKDAMITASWHLRLKCGFCKEEADYQATELKGLFPGAPDRPPKKP